MAINTDIKPGAVISELGMVDSQSVDIKPTLPSYKAICIAACMPVGFLIALALLTGHAFIALGIAGGLLVSLVMYAGIYSFVNSSASIALSTIGGKANASSAPMMPMFALAAVLKFVALAGLLYLLFRVVHIGLVAFAIGFLAAQISVTVVCIRSLTNTPLITRSGSR